LPERVSRYYKEPRLRKSHAKGILKIGKGVYNESIDKILNRILDRIEVSFVAKFLPLLLPFCSSYDYDSKDLAGKKCSDYPHSKCRSYYQRVDIV
jgi:hypothetical protein